MKDKCAACDAPVWLGDSCERCANLAYLVFLIARAVEQAELKERLRETVSTPRPVTWMGIE